MRGAMMWFAKPRNYPAFHAMLKGVIFCLALLPMTHAGVAQEQKVAVAQILPEDVLQGSIEQIQCTTNTFMVSWTYTEAGAKKMLELWGANAGKKNVRFVVGKFE